MEFNSTKVNTTDKIIAILNYDNFIKISLEDLG